MNGSTRPLLFLDIDGPLIPFGATRAQLPDGYPTYETGRGPRGATENPLITRVDPALGPRLLALPCDLVWATTWMSDANDCVGPWLGLPRLPLVEWIGTHWLWLALSAWLVVFVAMVRHVGLAVFGRAGGTRDRVS